MPEENMGISSGLIGMLNAFVDPAGTARRVPAKLFWVWPVITLSIIYGVFGYLMLPYTMQLVDIKMSQANIPPEKLESAKNTAHAFSQIGAPLTPVFVVLILMLLAWLVSVMGSMTGARAKFRDVFSLMSACALIRALQTIANYVVIRTKGDEIQSPEQLAAPFGLDILLQDVHGPLLAVLNFFSIFEIWYIVILTFAYAYLTKSSKGKAFIAITPAWVLPLFFQVIGSLFNRSPST